MGRKVISQGQNSNKEPVENSASNVTGLGRVGPELVQRSGVGIMIVTVGKNS